MARRLSDFNVFVSSIQRSLPKDATMRERAEAMKLAGQLWRQGVRSPAEAATALASPARSRRRNPRAEPNPGPDLGTLALWGVGALVLLSLLRQGQTS